MSYHHTMKRALLAILLAACTPEDEAPSSDTSETSGAGDEESTETGDDEDNWGIVLDVGPPHYGTEETG